MLTYLEKTAYASHRDVRSIRNRNLYDLMNIEYVIARREFNEANFEPVSQNDFHIYRNQTRSARVAIVPRARYVDSSEEALRWISHNSFDPSQEVILIGRSTGSGPQTPCTKDPPRRPWSTTNHSAWTSWLSPPKTPTCYCRIFTIQAGKWR